MKPAPVVRQFLYFDGRIFRARAKPHTVENVMYGVAGVITVHFVNLTRWFGAQTFPKVSSLGVINDAGGLSLFLLRGERIMLLVKEKV